MVCGIPKCTQTHSKKSLVVAYVVILFLQATRIAILENRSTTTKHSHFSAWWTGGPTCSPLRWIPMACQERKRGVQALFISGRFGNSAGSARPDILADLMLKFRPVEMFL
jgi:hypothetical protein